MSSVPPVQDMPPKGGYAKIVFERVPAKKVFTGLKVIAVFLTLHIAQGYWKVKYDRPRTRTMKRELESAKIALLPFLLAEVDRAGLLRLKENRDVEDELMKDVEGWETGTLYGEPIYKTIDVDTWRKPSENEYHAHTDRKALEYQLTLHHRG